ncbi:MAG: alpha/beta fold hydrolase [Actinomycetota bacterium]
MNAKDPRALKATWLAMQAFGRISRWSSGFFAAHLWFTPWPVAVSERGRAKQAKWLSATEPVTFDVDGLTVRGFSAGQGPVILLVHGWGESAASLGSFIEPFVTSGYRVVGIDMPAHGNSRQVETNLFQSSAVVRGVARQLGEVHAVIAHSIGGAVTTIALSEGLEVDRVALIAPVSNVHHAIEKFSFIFQVPEKAALGLRDHIERRFGSDVWNRLDSPALARQLTTPALIVHDTGDPQVDLADSETLAAAWPGAHLVVTEGLGHATLLRDASVIQHIQEFVTGVGSRLVSA